jgi:hypothetical protein
MCFLWLAGFGRLPHRKMALEIINLTMLPDILASNYDNYQLHFLAWYSYVLGQFS